MIHFYKKNFSSYSFFKNYYLYDYTTYSEFFIFNDLSFLSKKSATDDFSVLPSFKTHILSSFSYPEYFFSQHPFIENFYEDVQIDLTSFLYLKTSSFISFFVNNNIDVPTCFKKSKSLSFKSFELPLLKFFNLNMREGKRDKVIRIFFKKILNWNNKYTIDRSFSYSYLQIFQNNKVENLNYLDSFIRLKPFLTLVHNLFFFEKDFEKKKINFPFSNKTNLIEISSSFFFKNSFLKPFADVNPIFSYFIYNVDKNIRKYSRGKSGKYAFVWKYIPPYKRIFLVMRLFAKELKFRGEKQLYQRLINSVQSLEKDFKNSFVYRSKTFSHNYVFKNFKKTLLISLKTISK